MVADKIEREVVIAAPIERVWAAVTEAEHLGVWFGTGEPARVDFRPGGKIIFDHGVHGDIPARIERIERPRFFSYRWVATGSAPEPVEGNSTLVEFTLSPDGDGTLLRVCESGFTRLTLTGDELRGRYEANAGGWTRKLEEIRQYNEQLVP
jgi:uncharacterized protein YndB with AHSA1/START domain